jgi:hypothetical protein
MNSLAAELVCNMIQFLAPIDLYRLKNVNRRLRYTLLDAAKLYKESGMSISAEFNRITPKTTELAIYFFDVLKFIEYEEITTEGEIALGCLLPDPKLQHVTLTRIPPTFNTAYLWRNMRRANTITSLTLDTVGCDSQYDFPSGLSGLQRYTVIITDTGTQNQNMVPIPTDAHTLTTIIIYIHSCDETKFTLSRYHRPYLNKMSNGVYTVTTLKMVVQTGALKALFWAMLALGSRHTSETIMTLDVRSMSDGHGKNRLSFIKRYEDFTTSKRIVQMLNEFTLHYKSLNLSELVGITGRDLETIAAKHGQHLVEITLTNIGVPVWISTNANRLPACELSTAVRKEGATATEHDVQRFVDACPNLKWIGLGMTMASTTKKHKVKLYNDDPSGDPIEIGRVMFTQRIKTSARVHYTGRTLV